MAENKRSFSSFHIFYWLFSFVLSFACCFGLVANISLLHYDEKSSFSNSLVVGDEFCLDRSHGNRISTLDLSNFLLKQFGSFEKKTYCCVNDKIKATFDKTIPFGCCEMDMETYLLLNAPSQIEIAAPCYSYTLTVSNHNASTKGVKVPDAIPIGLVSSSAEVFIPDLTSSNSTYGFLSFYGESLARSKGLYQGSTIKDDEIYVNKNEWGNSFSFPSLSSFDLSNYFFCQTPDLSSAFTNPLRVMDFNLYSAGILSDTNFNKLIGSLELSSEFYVSVDDSNRDSFYPLFISSDKYSFSPVEDDVRTEADNAIRGNFQFEGLTYSLVFATSFALSLLALLSVYDERTKKWQIRSYMVMGNRQGILFDTAANILFPYLLGILAIYGFWPLLCQPFLTFKGMQRGFTICIFISEIYQTIWIPLLLAVLIFILVFSRQFSLGRLSRGVRSISL